MKSYTKNKISWSLVEGELTQPGKTLVINTSGDLSDQTWPLTNNVAEYLFSGFASISLK